MEDVDVIRMVKGGDVEAFSMLVEKYHRHLLHFVFTLVGDSKIVEDIGQEVFLSVYKSLKDFDETRGTPFSAWLFIAARNRCVSELRIRGGKEHRFLDDTDDLIAEGQTAEEAVLVAEKMKALKQSLRRLPEPYRTTLFRSLNGDSIQEIALRQGVSAGTVKSRLFRAKERMRLLIRDFYGGTGYENV